MERNAHQKNFSVVKNLPTTPMVESVFQNGGSVIIIWIVEMGKTKSIVVSTLYILLVKIYLSIKIVRFFLSKYPNSNIYILKHLIQVVNFEETPNAG